MVVIKDLEVRNPQSIENWKKEVMVMRYGGGEGAVGRFKSYNREVPPIYL
jgi:hypothetical protein